MNNPWPMVYVSPVIDGKVVGNTTIVTTDAGAERFFVDRVLFIPSTVTTLTTAPQVSVGITGALFIDLVANALLTTLSVNRPQAAAMLAADTVAPNTAIVCRVGTAAIGTAYSFRLLLYGFYL